ncbi:MAG: GNAT family N-acetyltransferase [Dongiaceae bacterium]
MHESLTSLERAADHARGPSASISPVVALSLRRVPGAGDIAAVRDLVQSTGFFSDQEVATAVELVEAYLTYGPACTYRFIFAEAEGQLAGYACYGAIPLTRSSYDLYWIAVRPALQGGGLGRRLIEATEAEVHAAGGSQIYVDTSSRPLYAATRAFYRRLDYQPAADLPDFYAPGDGKMVFAKRLG